MVRKKTRPNPSPVASKNKRSANDSKSHGKQNKDPPKSNDSTVNKRKPARTIKVVVQHHPQVQVFTKKMYKEIRNLQFNTRNLIPVLSFQRLIREIMQQYCPNELFRIQTEALRALQEAAEMYMTQYFEDAYFCCIHARRKTLYVSDMQCVRRLRGREDIINH